jgi:hypothetical protein
MSESESNTRRRKIDNGTKQIKKGSSRARDEDRKEIIFR